RREVNDSPSNSPTLDSLFGRRAPDQDSGIHVGIGHGAPQAWNVVDLASGSWKRSEAQHLKTITAGSCEIATISGGCRRSTRQTRPDFRSLVGEISAADGEEALRRRGVRAGQEIALGRHVVNAGVPFLQVTTINRQGSEADQVDRAIMHDQQARGRPQMSSNGIPQLLPETRSNRAVPGLACRYLATHRSVPASDQRID